MRPVVSKIEHRGAAVSDEQATAERSVLAQLDVVLQGWLGTRNDVEHAQLILSVDWQTMRDV